MAAWRGLRLFGHPVHPMLVHLPMGLLLTAPLWDLLGLARPATAAATSTVAGWTLAVGCLGGLAAAAAGLVDFVALPARHPAERAANLHLYLILGALGLYGASLVVRHGHRGGPSLGVLGLDLAGFFLLAAGGFFGAEMVYRHGIGRVGHAREDHDRRASEVAETTITPKPSGSGYHPKGT